MSLNRLQLDETDGLAARLERSGELALLPDREQHVGGNPDHQDTVSANWRDRILYRPPVIGQVEQVESLRGDDQECRGGRVDGQVEDDRPIAWSLAGDARLLAEGTLLTEATDLPEPPDWS